METVFLGCAIVGGGLFLLRSIAMFSGLGGDDGSLDDGGGSSHGDSVVDFKILTMHGLTAFFFMFGLVGFLMLRNDHANPWLAGTVAAVVGAATMFIIAKIFQSALKLRSDGTIYPKDAVGAVGAVYLTIRAGEIGKVQVTVRDALKIYDARARDTAMEIKTGERVKVVEANDDALIVEPA